MTTKKVYYVGSIEPQEQGEDKVTVIELAPAESARKIGCERAGLEEQYDSITGPKRNFLAPSRKYREGQELDLMGYEPKKPWYVLIAAKNEAHSHFRNLIRQLHGMENLREIVVVDDGSKDITPVWLGILKRRFPKLRVITNKQNIGKEGSLKRGLLYLANTPNHQNSWLCLMDADGQHTARDLEKMLYEADKNGDSCIVCGYRDREEMPRDRRFANTVTGLVFSKWGEFPIKDALLGQRVISGKYIQGLARDLQHSGGYRVEISLIYNLLNYGASFSEIPIETIYDEGECSGKSGMGVRNLRKSLANFLYSVKVNTELRKRKDH